MVLMFDQVKRGDLKMLQFWEVPSVLCGNNTPLTFPLAQLFRSASTLYKVIHDCCDIMGMRRTRFRERGSVKDISVCA